MSGFEENMRNAMAAGRDRVLIWSPQFTLGELIVALGATADQRAHVRYDFGEVPAGLASWRGSYRELALGHRDGIASPTVRDLLAECLAAVGRTFEGYKGGDFAMGRRTPIWVANYGRTDDLGIVGVRDEIDAVILVTAECEF